MYNIILSLCFTSPNLHATIRDTDKLENNYLKYFAQFRANLIALGLRWILRFYLTTTLTVCCYELQIKPFKVSDDQTIKKHLIGLRENN